MTGQVQNGRIIHIATRGSRLAMVQTNLVRLRLEALGYRTEVHTVMTGGDRNRHMSLKTIGGKGLFIREIEEELASGRADIAVHSGKDLPYHLGEEFMIGGIPEAASPEDCLISARGRNISGGKIVIGTASPRRESELRRLFPEAEFRLIRGNVDTRLERLASGGYDATVLAAAGLERLKPDLRGFTVRRLTEEECIPAACQGIIAIECRRDDREMREILAGPGITDPATAQRFTVERYLLDVMGADCSMAVGVRAHIRGEELSLHGMYEGKHVTHEGPLADYRRICLETALELMN